MFEDEEDDSYIYKATTLVSLMTTTTHIRRSVDASSRNSNIESELLRAMCWSQVSLRRRTFVFFYAVRKRTVTKHETLTDRERERERGTNDKRKKGKKRASEPNAKRRSAPSLFNLRNLEDKKKKERWIIFI